MNSAGRVLFVLIVTGLVLLMAGVSIFYPQLKVWQAERARREAEVLLEGKNLLVAERRITEALEIRPRDISYHILLGRILEAQGEYDKAEAAYGEAYKLDTNNPEPLFLAALVNFKMENDQAAAQILEKILLRHPNYVPALHQLAEYSFSRAKFEKCAEYYQRILDIQPEAEAYNGLGACYHGLDRLEEARQMFTEALRLNPDLDQARRNLELVSAELAELKRQLPGEPQ